MEIYLIRHTKPDVDPQMIYGQTDLQVASSFEEELKIIKGKLPENRPQKIYSSPLIRCHTLARSLAQGNEPIQVSDKLKEINFGELEQQQFPNMSVAKFKKWATQYLYEPVPQGESYDQMAKRFQSFWHDLRNEGPEMAYVVGHAGLFRTGLAYLLGMPLSKIFSFTMHYGQVIRVQYLFDETYEIEFL